MPVSKRSSSAFPAARATRPRSIASHSPDGRARSNAAHSYYAVDAAGTSASGLTSVLQSITSSLVKSCRLQLDSVPAALDQLNVQVDGVIVPQTRPRRLDDRREHATADDRARGQDVRAHRARRREERDRPVRLSDAGRLKVTAPTESGCAGSPQALRAANTPKQMA